MLTFSRRKTEVIIVCLLKTCTKLHELQHLNQDFQLFHYTVHLTHGLSCEFSGGRL